MSFRDLVGKKVAKKVKFMDSDIVITKLTGAQVTQIQEMAAENKKAEGVETNDTDANMEILLTVVRMSAEGAADLTAEEFQEFPLDDISKLANEIMKYSGLGEGKSN